MCVRECVCVREREIESCIIYRIGYGGDTALLVLHLFETVSTHTLLFYGMERPECLPLLSCVV